MSNMYSRHVINLIDACIVDAIEFVETMQMDLDEDMDMNEFRDEVGSQAIYLLGMQLDPEAQMSLDMEWLPTTLKNTLLSRLSNYSKVRLAYEPK